MPKEKKSFSRKLNQRYLQGKILKFLKRHSKKSYNAGTLARKLHIKNSKDSIAKSLEILATKEKLIEDRHGKYRLNPRTKFEHHYDPPTVVTGIVDMTFSGSAYVMLENGKQDVYVPKKNLYGALHGDTVSVSIRPSRGHRRPEGRIVEVKSRYRTTFMGVFRDFTKYGYVYIEEKYLMLEIKVLPEHFNQAEDGDTVIVEVTDFGRPGRMDFRGKVKYKFTVADPHDFKMNAILINNGFDLFFPDEVVKESEKFNDDVDDDALVDREDFRQKWTCTIDPVNAKDYDDALSYHELDDGLIEIGVHIADVTHFVKPGSSLDKEARKRSTSVYLVDRVCPMLPEKLSNDLCSLKPGTDRFTYSVIFEFKPSGELVSERFMRGVIHSDRRFTYDEVQEILEQENGQHFEPLNFLNKTANALRKRRFQQGSIDFDSDEVFFELDENKKPVKIKKKVRKSAHKLVEEFMLLANRKVAALIGNSPGSKKKSEMVYRIHDLPDQDKLSELALLAKEFGIEMKLDTPRQIAESLNLMTSTLSDSHLLNVLRPMAIRSMAKASYSSENIGHFGLGFHHYTHFTSPIRRYADVIAHRILTQFLSKELKSYPRLEETCKHISRKERDAINAERESIRYKQVEYLMDRLGEQFKGTVRSIIERGFFVELSDIQIDGMVSFGRLKESFIIHPSRIKAIGSQSNRLVRIGDEITVSILEANLDNMQIELEWVSNDDTSKNLSA